MRPAIFRIALCVLTLGVPCAPGAAAQEAEKPLLSEEIRAVLERDGDAQAQRRFDEIYPAQKDRYEIDLKGLTELGAEYMQAGEQATAQVILLMVSAITRDLIAEHAAAMPAAPPRPTPDTAPRAAPEPVAPPDRGLARRDLTRFHGLYGTPGEAGRRHDLFVTESCDGYLVVGAMWGDASNWWMRPVSDRAFAMSDSFRSLQIEFEVGPDGVARSMSHDLEGMPTPLPRVGPLPDGWEECVPRHDG